jgi:uncharacterized repeat protein (TIGR03803 family)
LTKPKRLNPSVSRHTAGLKPSRLPQWSVLKAAAVVLLVCAAATTTSYAQTVTTLLTFDGTDGSLPISGLVQGLDGNYYGTAYRGGNGNVGTAFKITPQGSLTTLYNFCSLQGCTDGEYPNAALVLATDGNFYGTTYFGGASALPYGTVFKLTPQGSLTTLYNFCSQSSCTDGSFPSAGLVQGADGNLYGATYEGGSNNVGTLFKITPKGQLTTIYSFCAQPGCADGEYPSYAGLVLGTDRNLYGVTNLGGANGNYGTVFKVTSSGKLTTLYSFCSQSNCADGIYPEGILQATNGSFYGTANAGGACPYTTQGCGTVFKLTSAGKLTTLYTFCPQNNCPDGANPIGLVQASDGNFYGTTSQGGISTNGTTNAGSIFKISATGAFTSLYGFCSQTNCADGTLPRDLVQVTSGSFIGTTESSPGTIFKLDAGLHSFVQAVPSLGKAGASVIILGNSLSGSTSVSFNGTVATFKVISATEIKATVPAGATTGKIKVVTTHGTRATNVVFRVTP